MSSFASHRWPFIFFLGTVWGVSECFLGLYLRQCASLVSGSIMTGAAIFFLAAGWTYGQSYLAIPVMVVLASLFKMADALLLSLPLQHGAVANPIFAFLMEGVAFWLIITFISETWQTRFIGQAFSGAFSALVAVNLFPLVKFVPGIPACVFPGTNFPLSLYYAPLAISLSAFTFPLGRLIGQGFEAWEAKVGLRLRRPWLSQIVASASLIGGLAILVIFRG